MATRRSQRTPPPACVLLALLWLLWLLWLRLLSSPPLLHLLPLSPLRAAVAQRRRGLRSTCDTLPPPRLRSLPPCCGCGCGCGLLVVVVLLLPLRRTSGARRNAERRPERAWRPSKQTLERIARRGRLASSTIHCSDCDCKWRLLLDEDELCAEYLNARRALRLGEVDEPRRESQLLLVVARRSVERMLVRHMCPSCPFLPVSLRVRSVLSDLSREANRSRRPAEPSNAARPQHTRTRRCVL